MNSVLYRKRSLCDAIERELMSVLGVNRYDTDAGRCRVDVEYDPRQITATQLAEILDAALALAEHPTRLDRISRELTICTASLPIAAVAQFAFPRRFRLPPCCSPTPRCRASGALGRGIRQADAIRLVVMTAIRSTL